MDKLHPDLKQSRVTSLSSAQQTSELDRTRPPALPNLTALRFFAAALVLGHHLTLPGALTSARGPLAPFVTQGFLGVPLFFVLSGFVLAYNYPLVTDRRRFYLARFARVYPLNFLGWLLMAPLVLASPVAAHAVSHVVAVLLALFLVQAWVPSATDICNPPAWTLSVEAFFYLCFPFLLPLVLKHVQRAWFWIVALWLAFSVPPLLANYPSLTPLLHLPRATPFHFMHFAWTPPCFIGEFLMGMFAGAAFRRSPRTFSGAAAAAVSLLCLAVIYLSKSIGYHTARNSGAAMAFVLLVYVFAGWRSRFLASSLMQLAGEISYSIYLLQFWVMDRVLRMRQGNHGVLLMIVLLLFLSLLTYQFVEKPARRLLLRLFKIHAPPKPLPTPQAMA